MKRAVNCTLKDSVAVKSGEVAKMVVNAARYAIGAEKVVRKILYGKNA